MAQAKAKDIAQEPTATPSLLRILTLVTVLGVVVALVFALVIAGTDIEQGEVQRIFYVHMPAFFGAFVAFGATVLGGVMYLWKRDPKWDRLAVAGVEVGFALALINLITGSIWARPIWNTWWTWDPRLTSEAIMVLTYAAYMMLRAGIDNVDTRRRFASVYGILAFATVLLVLFIIRVRDDTIHPTVVGNSPQNAQGSFAATSGVVGALMVGLLVWGLIVPVTLMWYRIRLENMLDWVNRKKMEVLSA
ncbi:MAG: cytochrome c biogenesis protein CcsA [Anaerolineae bacterium]|nr:cytochrome c biogenesis protein CcsA [Anaerolineae bacterium]MCA9896124.1 cytochrome c biogenesis protein CcsA [Anaerolineae bacterium]MCB9458965.1 cytochrome c biogenesis protein CcsA [Anaerolineaceae bacterium]